jgi:hypothetical protein
MKKYRIIRTVPGVRPGELHPFLFEEGTEHHIDDDLASQFFDQGAVEMIEDGEPSEEKPEEKSRGAAPSNKNRGAAPSNKSKAAE